MIVRNATSKDTWANYLFIVGLPMLMYLFESSSLYSSVSLSIYSVLLRPLLWCALAFIIRYQMNSAGTGGKLRLKSYFRTLAFNCAFIYIFISLSGGLIDGFGRSPYDHSPTGILQNILSFCTLLIGREFLRDYLVNKLTKKENYLVFSLVAFFMTITNIQFSELANIHETKEVIIFLATQFGPELCKNLFATYLVFISGPWVSITYLGIIGSFEWLTPILPDFKWITKGVIGFLVPLSQLFAASSWNLRMAKVINPHKDKKESVLGWAMTCLVSVLVLWFVFGVFPIYPSVIITGSMEPKIMPGDVILVSKIKDMAGMDKLEVGDVIQFKRDDIVICHRIIEIQKVRGEKVFKTKGDNNSSADGKLIKTEDIKGLVTYTVPKIGMPALLFKIRNDVPLDKVIF